MPANWPSPRRLHWQTLLQARAIENQAYVVGCNRVGTAGDGTEHVGDSRIVSPMGELLATAAGVETIVLADVDAAEVTAHPRPAAVPARPRADQPVGRRLRNGRISLVRRYSAGVTQVIAPTAR